MINIVLLYVVSDALQSKLFWHCPMEYQFSKENVFFSLKYEDYVDNMVILIRSGLEFSVNLFLTLIILLGAYFKIAKMR